MDRASRARSPGLIPFAEQPQLLRRDYVFNANDSHWVVHQTQRLTGFSPLLGPHGFTRVAYTEWGPRESEQTVLCVHGLTRNGRDFDFLARHLAQRGMRVVALSARCIWLASGLSRQASSTTMRSLLAPPSRQGRSPRIQETPIRSRNSATGVGELRVAHSERRIDILGDVGFRIALILRTAGDACR